MYPSVELEVRRRAVDAHTDRLLNHSTKESTILLFDIYVPVDGHSLIFPLLIIITFRFKIRRAKKWLVSRAAESSANPA